MYEGATVDNIITRLLEHLTASSEIRLVSKKFSSSTRDSERVNFVYELLKLRCLVPAYRNATKSDQLSASFRQDGNSLFKSKKDQCAVEMYTKSALYAEEKENLALAYANRSAVLFEHGFYRECLIDINLAKSNNYPTNLLAKLTKRQGKAEVHVQQQIMRRHREDLPKMKTDPNPKVRCAADSIEIKNTLNFGRHVIARRDIQIGEVIAIEHPFATILLREYSLNHCAECLKFCFNLIPCKECVHVAYCSETCLEIAWNTYHKHECPILDVLYRLHVTKFTLIALKIALLASKSFDSSKRANESIYKSENYEEIHDLITNRELRSLTDVFDRSVAAALVFHYVKNHTDFLEKKEDEDVFRELLLRHLQTGPSNFHEISELQNFESVEIGSGAYSFLSLLNHACNPNIVRHCYGTGIVLRSLSPIKKGEQLLDNYGHHYAVSTRSERQKSLKKQYHFQCECSACLDKWPLYDGLPEKDDCFKVDGDTLKKLQEKDEETAENILPKLLEKAAELDELKPCKNLSAVQECIKECYAIFANKSNML